MAKVLQLYFSTAGVRWCLSNSYCLPCLRLYPISLCYLLYHMYWCGGKNTHLMPFEIKENTAETATSYGDENDQCNSCDHPATFSYYSYCIASYGEIINLPNPPEITCITAINISIDLTTCLIIITPLMYIYSIYTIFYFNKQRQWHVASYTHN